MLWENMPFHNLRLRKKKKRSIL